MRKLVLLVLVLCSLDAVMCHGQQGEGQPSARFSVGYHLNNYQADFGMGVSVTSPFIAHQKLAFRMRANWQYHQHPDISTDASTWSGYPLFTVGVVTGHSLINNQIRVYGEGGSVALLPNHIVSNQHVIFGGYGIFGFEFYARPSVLYFIELGGMGTGAKEDKLPGKAIYSNGFITTVGMRFHL